MEKIMERLILNYLYKMLQEKNNLITNSINN